MPVVQHQRHGDLEVTDHVFDLIQKDKREWTPQRTEPWYEKRRNHITASLVASICGDNPYETRLAALRKKCGTEPPFLGNAATEHGNKYEQTAIELYEQRKGKKVIEFGLLESLNEGEHFMAGSPDGITADGVLIEVKCPFRRQPIEGVIPGHYMHQLQCLMHFLRLDECDFIEYVPGSLWREETFFVTRVARDDAFWERIRPKLESFWADVLLYRQNGQLPREEPARRRVRQIVIKEEEEAKQCLVSLAPGPESWGFLGSFIESCETRLAQDSAREREREEERQGWGECLVRF